MTSSNGAEDSAFSWVSEDPLPKGLRSDLGINFFTDESSQTAHRFLVIGTLIIRESTSNVIVKEYKELKQRCKFKHEIKWTKVGTNPVFKAFVDKTLLLIAQRKARFTVLILDTSTFDHKTYNEGDSEIGFNKLLYQQLLHRVGKKYGHTCPLYGYLDSRKTVHTPDRLRSILNDGLAKIGVKTYPFRRLQFVQSHDDVLVQAVDLLIGAIAFEMNEHAHASAARKTKVELSKYVIEQSKIKPCCYRFNYWHFEFKKGGRQA